MKIKRANSSLITLCKDICFRSQLTLILAVAFVIFLGGFFFSSISTEERRKRAGHVYIYIYTPYDSHEHSYDETHALAHVQSSNRLVIRAILSNNLTTLAFIVQQSHPEAR